MKTLEMKVSGNAAESCPTVTATQAARNQDLGRIEARAAGQGQGHAADLGHADPDLDLQVDQLDPGVGVASPVHDRGQGRRAAAGHRLDLAVDLLLGPDLGQDLTPGQGRDLEALAMLGHPHHLDHLWGHLPGQGVDHRPDQGEDHLPGQGVDRQVDQGVVAIMKEGVTEEWIKGKDNYW